MGLLKHQHLGLSNIAASLPAAFRANTECHALLAIQPPTAKHDALWQASYEEDDLASYFTYQLNVLVTPEIENIHMHVQFDPAYVSPTRVEQLISHYRHLCVSLAGAPLDICAADIGIATSGEIASIEAMRGYDPAAFGHSTPVHAAVDAIVSLQPDAVAVSTWDGSFTYAELKQVAATVAHELLLRQFQQNESVGIYLNKSRLLPLLLLAVLKAGAWFLLLDPTLPRVRLASQLEQRTYVLSYATKSITILFEAVVRKYNCSARIASKSPATCLGRCNHSQILPVAVMHTSFSLLAAQEFPKVSASPMVL